MATAPTVPGGSDLVRTDTDAQQREIASIGKLVRWLDDIVRIPGTRFGVGLDAALGAVAPGVGDAATGLASIAVLVVALRQRVPGVVIARMALNISVDGLTGVLPIVGDVFDALWRSNRRNLELLERHRGTAAPRPTWGDYAVVTLAIVVALAGIALPFFMLAWLVDKLV